MGNIKSPESSASQEGFELQPEEIRTLVSRISASAALRNSPRLQEILGHIVKESLAGRADHIKGRKRGHPRLCLEKQLTEITD